MTLPFLSDEWFAAVEDLRTRDGDPELPEKLRALVVNCVVKDEATGLLTRTCYRGCWFEPGHTPDAEATLTTTRELAFKVMIQKNIPLGVRAISTGKAKLTGDRKKLLALRAVRPTASQAAFEKTVLEMTSL